MRRHADAELDILFSETVPPIDLNRIGIFRAPMSKYEKKAQHPMCFEHCAYIISFQFSSRLAKRIVVGRWLMRRPKLLTSFLEQYLSHLAAKKVISWAICCHPRALERIAAATFTSTQSQLKEDIATIELYLQGVEEWANRQAALNVCEGLQVELRSHKATLP